MKSKHLSVKLIFGFYFLSATVLVFGLIWCEQKFDFEFYNSSALEIHNEISRYLFYSFYAVAVPIILTSIFFYACMIDTLKHFTAKQFGK